MLNMKRAFPWYLLAIGVLVLDQYTKVLALESLRFAQPNEVFPWLNFTLHYNTGAAFSMLNDASGWQRYFFTTVASVVSLVLVVWIFRLPRGQWLLALGLGLILGGAVGNLWDRVTLGHVVDFISVHYQDSYFPTFNIADSGISVGAVCVILDSFLFGDQKSDEEKSHGDAKENTET